MKGRVYQFLDGRTDGATSEEIAAEALRLQGARGEVADRVVEAALEGDGRFFRGQDGLWSLAPVVRAIPLGEATFVTVGLEVAGREVSGSERLVGIAGRRFRTEGREERFPLISTAGAEEGMRGALASFASFCDGAVPAAFRLPRLRRLVNRTARMALGVPLLEEGICLYRLGRRIFPNQPLPSLEALGEATGLAFLSERDPEGEANLQADILLFLLERYEAWGVTTVEAVVSDLYPDPAPVRFEAFAFDEAFLDELPRAPGVYMMRDRDGRVIYVGKSVHLRDRVRTYFARRAERPEKTRRILERIWSMEVETVGSELEALILEAGLIRLCKPEFNTQVVVHEGAAEPGLERNVVLVLPSPDPDSVELFCVREGRPLEQVRVRRDLADWEAVSGTVRRFYGEAGGQEGDLREGDAADLEILRRWLASKQQEVNVVDMEGFGSVAEALRVLCEYIKGCEVDGWEKVWRR